MLNALDHRFIEYGRAARGGAGKAPQLTYAHRWVGQRIVPLEGKSKINIGEHVAHSFFTLTQVTENPKSGVTHLTHVHESLEEC